MAVTLRCSLLGGATQGCNYAGCGSPVDDSEESVEMRLPAASSKSVLSQQSMYTSAAGASQARRRGHSSKRTREASREAGRRVPSLESRQAAQQLLSGPRSREPGQISQKLSRPRASPCDWCGSTRDCECQLALDALFEATYSLSAPSSSLAFRRKDDADVYVETTSTSEGGSEGQEDSSTGETTSGPSTSLSNTTLSTAPSTGCTSNGLTEEKDWRVRELRSRLSDHLGPAPGSNSAGVGSEEPVSVASAEARRAMAVFGGEGSCLRRFLKSVGHDVGAAEQKLRKTIDFRVKNNVSAIRDDPAAKRIWEELLPHWPEFLIGTTQDGSPVSYFDLDKAVAFCQLTLDEDRIRTFWIMWMEYNLQMQRQGRSQTGGGGSHQDLQKSIVVYNLSGLSLSRITKCMAGLRALVRVVGLAEEHYPDNLRRAIIINVPSLFYNCVWPLVTKVLNTDTLANITISDGDGQQAIQECRLQEISAMLSSDARVRLA